LRKIGSKNAHGVYKTQRIASALIFLKQYHKDSNEFLNHIVQVTGDETWVSFVNVETKEQSKQWRHTHSPKKPKKKLKQTLSACQKADGNCFLGQDKKGLVMQFMQQGTKIMSEVYCETLKKLHRAGNSEQKARNDDILRSAPP
jgi:hypothetical protein